MIIFTIGHSTRPLEEFLEALRAHGIELVVDVRRFPASRRHPHFAAAPLATALAAIGIGYDHRPELGGRRTPRKDSRNTAWRHPSFRGYADYMETAEFASGRARVLELAAGRRVALLCAERHWSACHRGLIADDLKARGHDVRHIIDTGPAESHPYTTAARIVDGQLSYAGLGI